MGCGDRPRKVFDQVGKRPRQGGGPGDQNIIGTRVGGLGQDGLGGGPQAPFGPVAGHGIAHFAAGGKAQAEVAVFGGYFGCLSDFQG
jgi:hypothetical protein